jgi:hypothetical protein
VQVGNLVRWGKAIGIVGATRCSTDGKPDHYSDKSSYIYWSDGKRCWVDDVALEVISESH